MDSFIDLYPLGSISSMDSFINSYPLLFCPLKGFRNEEEEYRFVQFGELPSSYDETYSPHDRPLKLCTEREYKLVKCKVCEIATLTRKPYYSCNECLKKQSFNVMAYHKECIEPILKHPYHPKHTLRLVYPKKTCSCCLKLDHWVYSCCICNFFLCRRCARNPPDLKIDHPKRHEHTLFLFPFSRKESLTCDICGLSHHESLIYSCHQCVFVLHKKCVYLPWVIRISRHEHRLSFNSSLTPEKWVCGVCRRNIDTNYGRYTCVKGCSYGVHSKCATRGDVWDGKELEGTPEDAYEDVKSFKEISDGVIEHFCHENHHMRLHKDANREFRRCQACALPISDYMIYSCMQCDDFILHQACAHLPRKKHHVLHPHSLSLQVSSGEMCSACFRPSNCFMYVCQSMGCGFKLDVCCASVSEPVDYHCHPHSLFLTSQYLQRCSICRSPLEKCLTCLECDFALCFRCASVPNKLRYEHDEHFLIHSYEKDASCQLWCDICEIEAYLNKNGVYMCNKCNITLHMQCLLGGDEIYMMPGEITLKCRKVNILPNNHLTRNICSKCRGHCRKKIFYKLSEGEMFCSYNCLVWNISIHKS